MAKAAVEMAANCIAAEQAGLSLSRYLGGTQHKIPCGISIGIQSSPEALIDQAAKAVEEKYQKLKVKIKPGKDYDYLRTLRDAFGDKISVMADANSAYTLDDIEHLKRFDELGLMMIEQPLRWDDFLDHSILQQSIQTPLCLDESIVSASHADLAIHMNAAKIINIKPGRVEGLSEAVAIHDACQKADWPVWCGGMLESGVGRAYNVALASLPHFSIPGDLSPSKRYWKEDIVSPEWEMDSEGYMSVPMDKVGLGIEIKKDYIEDLTEESKVLCK